MNTLPSDPGYVTDFIFHEANGIVRERPDYWLIRTPDNPEFWFGNYLLFKRAPRRGDFTRWMDLHREEFGDTLNHFTFAWDEPETGALEDFEKDGFKRSFGQSLSLHRKPTAVRTNPELEVRPVQSEEAWREVTALQVDCDQHDFAYPGDQWAFRAKQADAYRRMAGDGRGDWWGAWDRDQLVGSMGLFFTTDRSLGRFQNVATHRKWRRQRVCTTLLDHVTRHAFDTVGTRSLVICTGDEVDNPAIPTYQKFGFRFERSSGAVTRSRSVD